MTITRGLHDDDLRRLRSVFPGGVAEEDPPVGAGTGSSLVARAQAMMRRAAKGIIRRAIAWYVNPTARDAATTAAQAVYRRLEIELPERGLGGEARITAINQELLKGEFRALLKIIEELGQAIAPAAGIAGAASRMAEVRERLNDLDRRTRALAAESSAGREEARANGPPMRAVMPEATVLPPHRDPFHGSFDYLGFERRFRGDSDQLQVTLRERYLDMLRGHGPVLDLGCGRGELVAALAEAGIRASGVDVDLEAVAEARANGLNVVQADAVDSLRASTPGSLGAVVAIHLVEHMAFETLLEMVGLARERLRSGGLFIAETPNPASLFVLGNSYILDPTHVRPLHPSLFVFLCERAGFRDVALRFFEPARAYQLQRIDGDGVPDWVANINAAFERLNDVLFGPQEYAVIASVR